MHLLEILEATKQIQKMKEALPSLFLNKYDELNGEFWDDESDPIFEEIINPIEFSEDFLEDF